MSPPGDSEAGPRHRDRPTAGSPDEKLDAQSTPSAARTTRRHAGLDLRAYIIEDDAALWAEAFIRRLAGGADVPLYGTDGWLAADWHVQVASAVRAGEAWRRAGLTLERDLADELVRAGQWLDGEGDAFVAVACRQISSQPTHRELVERRRVA